LARVEEKTWKERFAQDFSGNFNGRIENAHWNVRIRLAVLLLLVNDTVMMEICDVLRALLQ
jgi:hypothetical protein